MPPSDVEMIEDTMCAYVCVNVEIKGRESEFETFKKKMRELQVRSNKNVHGPIPDEVTCNSVCSTISINEQQT